MTGRFGEDFVDSFLASESVQGGAGISVDRASGVLTISTRRRAGVCGAPDLLRVRRPTRLRTRASR